MYLLSSQGVGDKFSEDASTFVPIYEESEEDEEVRICHDLKLLMYLVW